jgi:hypothetical protein
MRTKSIFGGVGFALLASGVLATVVGFGYTIYAWSLASADPPSSDLWLTEYLPAPIAYAIMLGWILSPWVCLGFVLWRVALSESQLIIGVAGTALATVVSSVTITHLLLEDPIDLTTLGFAVATKPVFLLPIAVLTIALCYAVRRRTRRTYL